MCGPRYQISNLKLGSIRIYTVIHKDLRGLYGRQEGIRTLEGY